MDLTTFWWWIFYLRPKGPEAALYPSLVSHIQHDPNTDFQNWGEIDTQTLYLMFNVDATPVLIQFGASPEYMEMVCLWGTTFSPAIWVCILVLFLIWGLKISYNIFPTVLPPVHWVCWRPLKSANFPPILLRQLHSSLFFPLAFNMECILISSMQKWII